ncbi:MAG: glycoside hydrolase family 9 protein [Bacteroidales bacterium]|nr:glycoside hydrolase family 9 protein [Bacteroidales bacterium]MBN2820445.1 glycoside hydrolase family 9 protein [Bacteroidales bacterium]
MKKLSFYVLITLFFLLIQSCSNEFPITDSVHINSIGYLPDGNKIATVISDNCTIVNIRKGKNGNLVYNAKISGPYSMPDTNLVIWKVDFSGLTIPGEYFIEVPGIGRSIGFSINQTAYTKPYVATMKAFYYYRCGTEVEGVHKGDTFRHAPCHMGDGWHDFTEFGHIHADGTGGWHDAGDYGKYVVNAGITLHNLFLTWEHFSQKLEKIELTIPETSPEMPEFLQELKWETDYLLKMQYPDSSGRVSHKLTAKVFQGFIRAENDSSIRYFSDWSSDATANFAAVMAISARIFKPYNSEYAKTCLQAAERSYDFLKENPDDKPWGQREIRTGWYRTIDVHSRLWAAAELWETTGEEAYLTDFEQRAKNYDKKVLKNYDWGNVQNLGMFTYILSDKEGKNTELFTQLKSELIAVADSIADYSEMEAFGRPFDKYYWGCNGTVARLAITLSIANLVSPNEKYIKAGQSIIAHLFGNNIYGRSYVIGIGVKPPMNPHDRRSGSDDIEAPWPGQIVGGGHTPYDWVDEESSFSHNEVAINWQAPLVYVLAWFTSEE